MMDEKQETKRATLYDELFPGRFLKAALLQGKYVTLRISDVYVEKMPEQNGRKKWRGIVSFEKTEMQLALNRTNGECLKAMFGEELAKWVGKRIIIYPRMVEAFGAQELAIRVHGSPDLEKDMRATIVLPRKKPFDVWLRKAAPAKGKVAPPPPPEPVEEEMDAETGEVPFEAEPAQEAF